MTIPTIFDLCVPRADVRSGTSSDSDFAADLSRVLRGHDAPPEYAEPARFFANTHPTRGLKGLLTNVCGRLSGRGASVAAIFRLDTRSEEHTSELQSLMRPSYPVFSFEKKNIRSKTTS